MQSLSPQGNKTLFKGRYKILQRIGQGSMGTVYLAELIEMPGQMVALKVLADEHLGNRRVLQRFQTELSACYKISHPNVVRPIEVVKEHQLFGYSMEYIEGGNLVGRKYNNDFVECVRILKEIASALSAVHAAGVIHRDLKPENILLTQDQTAKLTDFGAALLIGGPRLTSEGNVIGSIPYLSPEYVESHELDGRSDLYSLGIIAFELVTGAVPFSADGLVTMINNKLLGRIVSPAEIVPSIPKQLETVILRLLQKDPLDRFQTAQAVADEFRILQAELSAH
jgi:serine/threonine protein kinase